MTSFTFTEFALKEEKSESCSVISDSLWPHELFSPWNSPDKTNGVGSLALLQGVFPNLGSNPGLLHCRQSFYQLSHKGNPRILEWIPVPSPADLPNPGIKLGSSALQVDYLPTELSGRSEIEERFNLIFPPVIYEHSFYCVSALTLMLPFFEIWAYLVGFYC